MEIKIIKLDKDSNLMNYNCCLCGKSMILSNLAVQIGSVICHLTCYKGNINRKMKGLDIQRDMLIHELSLLEPYSKEMICETLEGIGEK